MDWHSVITIEAGKRSGKPIIRRLRITVQNVLEYLAGGTIPEQIVQEFPELTLNDVRTCPVFAADRGVPA